MHAFGRLPVLVGQLEPVGHVDALDDQHLFIFLDVTDGFRDQEALTRRYLTRFQRASECPGQSTTGGGDQIVQGCRMWIMIGHADAIMFSNFGVYPKLYRLIFNRQVGAPVWTPHAFYPHFAG